MAELGGSRLELRKDVQRLQSKRSRRAGRRRHCGIFKERALHLLHLGKTKPRAGAEDGTEEPYDHYVSWSLSRRSHHDGMRCAEPQWGLAVRDQEGAGRESQHPLLQV